MPITEPQNLPIRDSGAHAPPLGWLYFLGVAATSTMTGYFVDLNGAMVGTSFTKALNTGSGSADPQNFYAIYGKNVPDSAVGFVGQISGQSAYVAVIGDSNQAAQLADFKANYARYPQLGIGRHALGRSFGVATALEAIGAGSSASIGSTGILPTVRDPITITPTMDTSALTANDVWFDSTVVTNASRATDEPVILAGIVLYDQDDQTAAAGTVYVLQANVSVGTINNAPSISDANALNIIAAIPFASADWKDLGGVKINRLSPAYFPLMCIPASGTRNIYVAAVNEGTPTNTATGVKVALTFQDAIAGA